MSITEDSLVSYAFGHLNPDEEAVVEAHLSTHPEDAATVSGYLDSLSALVLTLPPEPALGTGKTELLARVRSAELLARVRNAEPTPRAVPAPTSAEPAAPVALPVPPPRAGRRSSPLRRYGWLGALAAAVLVLLYLNVSLDPDTRTARALQEYRTQPGAVTYELNGEGPEPLGTLVQLQDGRVFVALATPPTAEQVYQAWAIADAPVSLGIFDGRTFLSAEAVSEGSTFGLTLEPPGGNDQPTTTPLTLLEL